MWYQNAHHDDAHLPKPNSWNTIPYMAVTRSLHTLTHTHERAHARKPTRFACAHTDAKMTRRLALIKIFSVFGRWVNRKDGMSTHICTHLEGCQPHKYAIRICLRITPGNSWTTHSDEMCTGCWIVYYFIPIHTQYYILACIILYLR